LSRSSINQDRNFAPQNKLHSVVDLGVILFRDIVIMRPPDKSTGKLMDRLCSVLLANINSERQGESIDRYTKNTRLVNLNYYSSSLVRNITSMLVQLAVDLTPVYEVDFERPFLAATAEFYARESVMYLSDNDAATYVKKAEKRLKEEDERVDHYLDQSTRSKLIRTVEKELISTHVRKLLDMENTGLIPMLEVERFAELTSFYRLLSRVEDGLKEMRACLMAHIQKTGNNLNNDSELVSDAPKWVQAVIDLKDKYDRILTKAFERDKAFQTSINDVMSVTSCFNYSSIIFSPPQAFEKVVRQNTKSSENLALFLDNHLKQGIKGVCFFVFCFCF